MYTAFGGFFDPVGQRFKRRVTEWKHHATCFRRDYPNEYANLLENQT